MDERLKTHFEVLFGSLKDYQSGLLAGSFTTSGFLILVIGWLLTSKEARSFLGNNASARRLGALALGVGFLVYAAVSWRVFQLSQVAFNDLVVLNYVPQSAYVNHRIAVSTLLLFMAQNALITLVACSLMLNTVHRKTP